MARLKIVKITNDKYLLQDLDTKETYSFNIKFYGLEQLPQVGDMLGFHKELLDKNYDEYNTSYQFGPINEPYGRKISGPEDVDCILLKTANTKTYLKRFFG